MLKNPKLRMRVRRGGTYFSRGLSSEESKEDIEGEIEKIKDKALALAKDIVKAIKPPFKCIH